MLWFERLIIDAEDADRVLLFLREYRQYLAVLSADLKTAEKLHNTRAHNATRIVETAADSASSLSDRLAELEVLSDVLSA